MYQAYVVLVKATWCDAREYCESIKDIKLDVGYDKDIIDIVVTMSLCPPPVNRLVSVWSMSDFVDMCNNGEEFNLFDFFISYIYVNVKSL